MNVKRLTTVIKLKNVSKKCRLKIILLFFLMGFGNERYLTP